MRKIITLLAWTAIAAVAQTGPSFEVASIKPSAPLDMGKMAAAVQSGQMPRIGPHIDGARAEYIYMSLKDLIVMAYKVKPYQVVGPAWMATQRFDIAAEVPEGASSDDVPKMLQALLADRFKLVVRRETKEHAVLALVVGKGGPKLKASAEAPPPIDEDTPLKPGEMPMDGPDGKMRMTMDKTGGATLNMGAKGIMHYKLDPATQSLRLEGSMVTMSGFADMLTRLSQTGGRGGAKRRLGRPRMPHQIPAVRRRFSRRCRNSASSWKRARGWWNRSSWNTWRKVRRKIDAGYRSGERHFDRDDFGIR